VEKRLGDVLWECFGGPWYTNEDIQRATMSPKPKLSRQSPGLPIKVDGALILKLRKQRKYSQTGLGILIGVSDQVIMRIKNRNQALPEIAKKLADVFKVPLSMIAPHGQTIESRETIDGPSFRRLLSDKKMSIQELARQSGVGVATLYRIAAAKGAKVICRETIEALIACLGCQKEELQTG
jgi:transcriptional regulator with XRE-family HTH domain